MPWYRLPKPVTFFLWRHGLWLSIPKITFKPILNLQCWYIVLLVIPSLLCGCCGDTFNLPLQKGWMKRIMQELEQMRHKSFLMWYRLRSIRLPCPQSSLQWCSRGTWHSLGRQRTSSQRYPMIFAQQWSMVSSWCSAGLHSGHYSLISSSVYTPWRRDRYPSQGWKLVASASCKGL